MTPQTTKTNSNTSLSSILSVSLSPKQYLTVSKNLISKNYTYMVLGKVGIGKTSISVESAKQAGCEEVIVETPHLKEPTDYHGYPFAVSSSKADFLPIGTLYTILNTNKRTHVVFDELDKAPIETMNAVAQLILQREVNGRQIPECVSFSATANRRTDKAGSNLMPTHLVDRFACILSLEQNIDDWSSWAINQNYPLEFIAFNRFKPEYLLNGQDLDKAKDLVKSPTPRTIATFGRFLMDGLDEMSILSACAGASYATEFLAFRKLFTQVPSIDNIFLNPLSAPIPNAVDILYALTAALASKVTPNSMQAFMTYCTRLPKQYEMIAIIMATQKQEALTHTPAYVKWAADNVHLFI